MRLEYVVVIVCPFAEWVKAFLCQKAAALMVTEKLIDFVSNPGSSQCLRLH